MISTTLLQIVNRVRQSVPEEHCVLIFVMILYKIAATVEILKMERTMIWIVNVFFPRDKILSLVSFEN